MTIDIELDAAERRLASAMRKALRAWKREEGLCTRRDCYKLVYGDWSMCEVHREISRLQKGIGQRALDMSDVDSEISMMRKAKGQKS